MRQLIHIFTILILLLFWVIIFWCQDVHLHNSQKPNKNNYCSLSDTISAKFSATMCNNISAKNNFLCSAAMLAIMPATLSATMCNNMPAKKKTKFSASFQPPCRPPCSPPCWPPCQPLRWLQQCFLDTLRGLRDSDRTEIQMTTDGLTGVCARDGVTGDILNERGLAAKYVISFYWN